MSEKSEKRFHAKTVRGTVAVETLDGGDEALVRILEEALAAARENLDGVVAGKGEHRESVFERIDVGTIFTMAHRS